MEPNKAEEMELYTYSPTGIGTGQIENFRSFRWVKKFGQVGSFKLVCPAKYRELLTEGTVLWPSGDEEAGFVRTAVITVKRGKEELEVAGETLSGLWGRRIIWKDISFTGREEALMRRIVRENAISPADAERGAIPRLVLGPECGAAVTVEEYESEPEPLAKALATRSAASALGFKTLFDPGDGGMTFVVYEGVDRSERQAERSQVVFADGYDNMIAAEYRESDADYANAALVEGERDKDDNPVRVSVGDATGLERRETYIRATDVKRTRDDGRELTAAQYRAALREYGRGALAKLNRTQAADATILATAGNLVYGEDWRLGDIVTLQLDRWGVMAHLRVSQVDEAWERGKHDVVVTFGEDVRTSIERG